MTKNITHCDFKMLPHEMSRRLGIATCFSAPMMLPCLAAGHFQSWIISVVQNLKRKSQIVNGNRNGSEWDHFPRVEPTLTRLFCVWPTWGAVNVRPAPLKQIFMHGETSYLSEMSYNVDLKLIFPTPVLSFIFNCFFPVQKMLFLVDCNITWNLFSCVPFENIFVPLMNCKKLSLL